MKLLGPNPDRTQSKSKTKKIIAQKPTFKNCEKILRGLKKLPFNFDHEIEYLRSDLTQIINLQKEIQDFKGVHYQKWEFLKIEIDDLESEVTQLGLRNLRANLQDPKI